MRFQKAIKYGFVNVDTDVKPPPATKSERNAQRAAFADHVYAASELEAIEEYSEKARLDHAEEIEEQRETDTERNQ